MEKDGKDDKKRVIQKRRSVLEIDKSVEFFEDIINKKKNFLDILVLVENQELNDNMRKMCWMICLGILPFEQIQNWEEILSNLRSKYSKSIFKDNFDLEQFKDLKHIVSIDSKRTYQEFDLFKNNKVQDVLIKVLFTWAIENQDLGYVQGMNELAGTILYVLYGCIPNSNENELYYYLNSPEFIEEDTYKPYV